MGRLIPIGILYIPSGFCLSYTVPLPKVKDCRTAAMTWYFRGIAISSILSKVFEHCISDRFRNYFATNDNQFGCKKNLSDATRFLRLITLLAVLLAAVAQSMCSRLI
jgi:hypothetical protein